VRLIVQIFGILVLGLITASAAHTMESAEYFPADSDFDASIPSPESVLGWEVGDWRVDHPALVQYMQKLSDESDRVSIKVIGYSHEKRPLLQLVISSAENQSKLESLRQTHLDAAVSGDLKAPLVVWLGYSVHGNEASGSNAAGLNRFASWANTNSSATPVGDRNGRIHHEVWPSGRTNHYLFDLNRDWLPLVHPESRARIAEYHRWLPHVITDHHETGGDGFFFQPGVPSRQHPLTTSENLEMTRKIAKYHARSLDSAGVMFYTEDTFDDFYYGKGSTYPDINGSIGILFEQPRTNGKLYNRDSGPLTFTQAIHNHVRTSLSTLEGAHELRDEFRQYQSRFFQAMRQRADKAGFKAWVIGDDGDPARALDMLNIFKQHGIEYHVLEKEISVDGQVFSPLQAWVIPVNQRQFGLAQAMLEKRTEFEDDTFYDVSAWSFPLAYNLPYAKLTRLPSTSDDGRPTAAFEPEPDAVAWVISWRQLDAPVVLRELLEAGATVRAATRPFTVDGQEEFSAGSLIVLSGIQDMEKSDAIYDVLVHASERGMDIHSFNTHLTTAGPGLGTSYFKPVTLPRPLLITGEGVSSYGAGEAWHLLDQRLGIATVMVDMNRLKNVNLHNYTHLLMADGSYEAIDDKLKKRMAAWVKEGGTLIAIQGAVTWAESLCFSKDKCEETQQADQEETAEPESFAYDDFDQKKAELTIGGAIVTSIVDGTHPVAFGYHGELPLFRRGSTLLKASENPFTTAVRYAEKPLLSGYIGEDRLEEMSNQAAVIAQRHGKGAVIRFANNPIFRGYWRGTERLWVNALYFGPLIRETKLPE